ncbi:SET domain-containing protein [Apiospora marii]|uniref:SET domain-containing protein n=1 Tax=Apiospora marii TaxID=335849 RepID=UPI00312DD7B6
MAFQLNWNVEIRQCDDALKCLGLFAVQRLSKGLKVLSEAPLLVYETRDNLVADVEYQFPQLPGAGQQLFTRMYAGYRDLVPRLPVGEVRDAQATRPRRLRDIARLNSYEGVGIGCVLSPGFAAINHEPSLTISRCSPNAFMYYNPNNGLLSLHALRDIGPDEEITISYFQEMCKCCDAVDGANQASEDRRSKMKSLRAELTAHHQAEAPTMDAIRQAIAVSRQLIDTMEQEGLFGIEMALCLAEQSRLYALLGDDESKDRLHRQSLIVRRLCIGAEHPSCMPGN